ncbi:MAG TPA: 2Fe-2S iron-sulfur cluster-binding protein, partial [Acetobacteraceae bacterium]|nr:2Fe-2S iron-sulfur cluster-binding protein [Acetobacteraceae bacterium]
MRDEVRFLLGDEVRTLRGVRPTLTVLEWLRTVERRCGTKEGCAEGDCGACTVLLGTPEGIGMRYRAVNACILFVPALDWRHLLTVEDLRGAEGGPHPVQQAMVDHHGSQCGFCTPGFVMTMAALHRTAPPVPRAAVREALAGNLCRCTGYRPILAAAEACAGKAGEAECAQDRAVAARLWGWTDDEPLEMDGAGGRYAAPETVDDLIALVQARPGAAVLAG